MSTKHTPGPWKIENHTEHTGPYSSARFEVWSQNRHIATIHEHVDDISIDVANATLIATAPELLDKLIGISDNLQFDGYAWSIRLSVTEVKRITELLAKARGGGRG